MILGCICRSSPDLLARIPSRITALAQELRDILIAILPVAQGASAEMAATHRAIRDNIDPELIAQEVAHGILDFASLARFLVPILKAHCAPMRDELVDQMVCAIQKGQDNVNPDVVAYGLRCCFSVLEVMKLDIANHQLRVVRPYLLETAAEFERTAFLAALKDKPVSQALPKTRAWVNAAASRQACDVSKASQQDFTNFLTDGILETLFKPTLAMNANAESKSCRSGRRLKALRLPSSSDIPETLELDVTRLQSLHAEVTDLCISSLLLLLYRQMCSTARRQPTTVEVAEMKGEILVLQREALASTGTKFGSLYLLADPAWRERMQDVVLQIARRAGRAGKEDVDYMPPFSTLAMLRSWLDNNLVAGSALVGLPSRLVIKRPTDSRL